MKVLVTGATGFIGTHVIAALQERQVDIVASSSGERTAAAKDWFGKISFRPLDLAALDEATDYFRYFGMPDRVIHLAWEGLPNYKSDFHEKVNLPRHFSFLSNLIRNGLKDLTVTGTCFEYGMQEGCLSEAMTVSPGNYYGRAKNELRIKLEALKSSHAFRLKWVRLFYMYGPGQHPNSLLSQLERALLRGDQSFDMSGGEQVRDYLPVQQVAHNIVEISLQDKTEGIINNCSGIPVTVKQLVEDYLHRQHKKIKLNFGVYPYPDYEPMRFWGDASKLKKIVTHE